MEYSHTGSQALSHDQHLMIPCKSDDDRCDTLDTLRRLPLNLNREREAQKSSLEATVDGKELETLVEGDEDEEQLQIAWQYRKSVQEERSGVKAPSGTKSAGIFCHSYDLSRTWSQDQLPDEMAHLVALRGSNGHAYFVELIGRIQALLAKKQTVIRLWLREPPAELLCTTLPLLLAHIRAKSWPVVILVTVKPWSMHDLACARRSADVVVEAEGFAARREYPPPAEFRSLHGLLHIHRLALGGSFADWTADKRPAAWLYGFKRDRRKLHIQLLHIPPEDYAEGGSSVGGGGVRSGAGRQGLSCSTAGGGNQSLDF